MEIRAFNFSEAEFSGQDFSNSKNTSVEGDEIKDAFLSLLQSLVGGVATPNSNLDQILNVSKVDTSGSEERQEYNREEYQVEYKKQDDKLLENKADTNLGKEEKSVTQVGKSNVDEVKPTDDNSESVTEVVSSTEQKVESSKVPKELALSKDIVSSDDVSKNIVVASSNAEAATAAPAGPVATLVVANELNSDDNLISQQPVVNKEMNANVQRAVQVVDSNSQSVDTVAKALNPELRDKVSKKLDIIGAQKMAYEATVNVVPDESALKGEVKPISNNLSSSLVDAGIKKSPENINFLNNGSIRSQLGDATFNLNSSRASIQKASDSSAVFGLQAKSTLDKTSTERLSSSSVQKRSADAQAFVDKVKEVLNNLAASKSNDSITIKIDPPHLGEITVRVSQKLGEIHAKIMPESKEVEKTLIAQSSELSLVLQALGFREDQVKVTIGRQGEDFAHYKGQDENAFSNRSEFRNSNQDLKSDKKSFKDQEALGIFLGIDKEDSSAGLKSSTGLDVSGWVA